MSLIKHKLLHQDVLLPLWLISSDQGGEEGGRRGHSALRSSNSLQCQAGNVLVFILSSEVSKEMFKDFLHGETRTPQQSTGAATAGFSNKRILQVLVQYLEESGPVERQILLSRHRVSSPFQASTSQKEAIFKGVHAVSPSLCF